MVEVTVTLADASYAHDIARVHSAAWRAAFTFLPPDFLEALTPGLVVAKWNADLLDPSTSLFVGIQDGRVSGFLQLRVDGAGGEVMSLYVDPSAWGQGVGSRLLDYGEARLGAQGAETAVLWTARDSEQSRGFYGRRGWMATGEEQTQHLGPSGVVLHEVEYRKPLG